MAAKIIGKMNNRLERNHIALFPLKDQTVNATNAVASRTINSSNPPTATSVITAGPSKKLAIGYLDQAHELIEKERFENALTLLSRLIKSNKGDKSLLVLSAECYIGSTFSPSKDLNMQAERLKQAKDSLDAALEITKKEDSSNPTITEELQCIIRLYKDILALSKNNQAYCKDANSIKQLSTDIHTQINFCKKLQQEQARPNEIDNSEEARDIVDEVLHFFTEEAPDLLTEEAPDLLTEEEDTHLLFLANAEHYISIAKRFEKGPQRTQHSKLALDFAKKAYAQQAAFLPDFPALDVYESFKTIFFELSRLLPEDKYIMETYAHCLKVYEYYYDHEHPTTGPQENGKEKTYLATKEPVGDFWKPFRLFVAFAFAFIVIGISLHLGRRSITRLN
ncbi:MAG TPA: hypothetical protein VFU89_06360 [Rhabdochlamydiaceae bacterium]|nr:hypothetical protein [Rhabdochlamydiaceae bacterium]